MVTGGCFCGKVRYELSGTDYLAANCHCTMCRRTSGAAFVSWIMAPVTDFRYTKGEPKLLESSDKGTRYFCSDCGTPVTCVIKAHPENIDVTIGSLDKPEDFPPRRDFYADTRLPWISATTRKS